MIELNQVTAYQQQTQVFDRLSLKIGYNERVAILGPNGAGKSTLLKLMTREIHPVDKPGSYLKLPYTSALNVVISGFFGAIGAHSVTMRRMTGGDICTEKVSG